MNFFFPNLFVRFLILSRIEEYFHRCSLNSPIKLAFRLVDVAPHYYDLTNFPNCEAKRVLERLYKKREKEKEESKNRR